MNPVFLDFHIHTSENPERLDEAYDVDMLKSRIEEIADGSEYLISLAAPESFRLRAERNPWASPDFPVDSRGYTRVI
jgi:hypothetical protein